ncbi:hypothetical protein BC827DRAFT_1163077 [Russula dissimulans]|nr:hypothetical protein BC827DRAFT_1163077 [Russula dissimulans]
MRFVCSPKYRFVKPGDLDHAQETSLYPQRTQTRVYMCPPLPTFARPRTRPMLVWHTCPPPHTSACLHVAAWLPVTFLLPSLAACHVLGFKLVYLPGTPSRTSTCTRALPCVTARRLPACAHAHLSRVPVSTRPPACAFQSPTTWFQPARLACVPLWPLCLSTPRHHNSGDCNAMEW